MDCFVAGSGGIPVFTEMMGACQTLFRGGRADARFPTCISIASSVESCGGYSDPMQVQEAERC